MPGRSHFFSVPEEIVHFFTFLLVYFGISYIWPMYQSLDKKNIWFTIIFLPIKRGCHCVPDMDFVFVIPSLILSQVELLWIELPKLTPSILMGHFDHFICSGWSIPFLYAPVYSRLLLSSSGNTECFWDLLPLLGAWKLVRQFRMISKKLKLV